MFLEPTVKYFSQVTVSEYFEITKTKFPFLHSLLDRERFSSENIKQIFSAMKIIDFEGDTKGGRGRDYFLAQNKYPLNRSIGFQSIFNLIGPAADGDKTVLDILGGNGTLYRAAKLLNYDHLKIIINDISEEMIENAFKQNIPCIRQPAQDLLFKNACLDAVIFAYGTHHIPIKDRLKAFEETKRVLQPGGTIVFHDYEHDSMTSKWYSEVLHEFTYTGHDFIHFYKDQLRSDLLTAGFADVEVFYSYDPFVIEAETAEAAKEDLLDHLISLFGLKKFREAYGYDRALFFAEAEKLVRKYADFRECEDEEINAVIRVKELTTYPYEGKFRCEMPRYSLMASGKA
ncbi:MAG: class I SAM-dependent methyltransferase [Bacteroidota bacterium]